MGMTIEQFASFINHSDQEKQVSKYFDEHLAIYAILSEMVGDNSKLIIDFKEDKGKCQFILSSISNDLSFMQGFFKDLQFRLAGHHYKVEVRCVKGTVHMQFIDNILGV